MTITTQKELNLYCERLERRLEYLEQKMLDIGNYTYYRRKKSDKLLARYNMIQDEIQSICSEFRRNKQNEE